MIKYIDRYCKHSDARGSFEGLINSGEWKEINMVSTVAGQTRGNHYHKSTTELFIIIYGKIKVVTNYVNEDHSLASDKYEYEVSDGDVFLIEPMVNHTFIVTQDSKWINVLSNKMDGREPFDIHRTEN